MTDETARGLDRALAALERVSKMSSDARTLVSLERELSELDDDAYEEFRRTLLDLETKTASIRERLELVREDEGNRSS